MPDLDHITSKIKALAKTSNRIIVGITGAPGSGKSTIVSGLSNQLDSAVVVPMDGFHLDNEILQKRGMMSRKGSPATFDAEGYYQLVSRLKQSDKIVYAPTFDRSSDLSRAGAIEISREVKVVLTEGNYLLFNEAPWNKLTELFDLTVYLDVPEKTLRERLIDRWLSYGLTREEALKRAESNDLINAMLVTQHSKQADIIIENF